MTVWGATDLVAALEDTIHKRLSNTYVDPYAAHERISAMYNWRNVTARTEIVYEKAMQGPYLTTGQRMRRYLRIGGIVGPLFVLVFVLGKIILWISEYFTPTDVNPLHLSHYDKTSNVL